MKNIFLFVVFSFLYTINAQNVLLSEDFSNGLPKDWKVTTNNDYRKWQSKSYNNVHYIQMSAFGGKSKPGIEVETKLITPLIDFSDKKCKLKFVFADAFSNGQPLNLMLLNDSDLPLKSISDKYWNKLVNNPDFYDNLYESTDWIELPQINQPYKIAFIYSSKKKDEIITTTIQLSEVDIWCE